MDIIIEELNEGIWAAAVQKGKLEALEVDPSEEQVRWGSIFRGRVKTIDAAQDAVFVDLDGTNTGILYNKDVRIQSPDGSWKKNPKPVGKVLQPGQLVTVQAKSGTFSFPPRDKHAHESKITQLSMDLSLQGRYVVFCPLMQENRLSARIRNKGLRAQMMAMLEDLEDINGCILRLAAADIQTEILRREGRILKDAWEEMSGAIKGEETGMIVDGPGAVQRLLSDQARHHIDKIEIVTLDHMRMAEDWCMVFAPDLVTRISPVEMDNATDDFALFYERDIVSQIKNALSSYAVLPGGGNVIIQNTAALTAIDVNRGGDKNSALAVNLEAITEIARQIRVRNMGGIIMLDLLRLPGKKEVEATLKALEDAFEDDPCTVQVHGQTALGLWEISRKRRTPPLTSRLPDKIPF